jgi:t-SNARE complex subunit (syntaxin)
MRLMLSLWLADNIEQNVFHVTQDTRATNEQLVQAHASQKRAGRRALCLLIILLVVLSVVFVAVRAWLGSSSFSQVSRTVADPGLVRL